MRNSLKVSCEWLALLLDIYDENVTFCFALGGQVKATNGDTFLGGEDFDNALLQHMVAEFKKDQVHYQTHDSLAVMQGLHHAHYWATCIRQWIDSGGVSCAMLFSESQ